ncbi:MAG: hypothetical protein GPJ21_13410 [Microcystis aeruginosa W13-11]|nr:hypothetical protein [Microcystis aeruginosa W13-11]
MKSCLCLHLMANKEKGFALPLALLIGLILMVTGITMMIRAQGDQSKVIAQKSRADALRSVEAGVTRVRDLLNSVRVMATVYSNCQSGEDCWQTAEVPSGNPSTNLQRDLKKLAIATACGNPSRDNEIAHKILAPTEQRAENPGLGDLASGQWFDLGNNRYYRVVGYNFNNTNPPPNGLGWGVLTLEGLSRTGATTNLTIDDDNAASLNRVVVSIPILPSLPLAFTRTTVPALWISEGATENVGQTSQITVGSPDYSGGANFQGDVVMSGTTVNSINLNVEPTATLQPELECFISTNKIQQPTPAANPYPPYKAQFVGVFFPDLPPIPEGIPDLGNLTSSETFHRPGDTPSPSGVYEYIVNNINLSGSDKITITPGQRVVFYVKGNINGAIEHNCGTTTGCKPSNLQIYANNELNSTAPQICLTGNQTLQAFIFAPDYSLGKTGTGAFVGAAWGKSWGKIPGCASPDGAVAVTQTEGVEWTDLITNLRPAPVNTLPQLGKIANWFEEPIPPPSPSPGP